MGFSSPRLLAASTWTLTGNGSAAEPTLGVRPRPTAKRRPALRFSTSEVELHAELELPRRAESAGDAARRGRVDRGGRRVEARRVRQVEALRAELEVLTDPL